MHVGLEERNEVWAGLRDDEVIHIEEFCNSHQRRVPVCVGDMSPVVEVNGICGCPGNNVAVLVFAKNSCSPVAVERAGRCVRCHCSCPDQL